MRIHIVKEPISFPDWFGRLFLIYSFFGFFIIFPFSEDYVLHSYFYKNVVMNISDFLPGISKDASSFPRTRSLYLTVMFFVLISTVLIMLLSAHKIPASYFNGVNFRTVILRFFCALFISAFIFFMIYFNGLINVSADISRAKFMYILINESRIGMIFSFSLLFDCLVLCLNLAAIHVLIIMKFIFNGEKTWQI